MTGSTFVEYIFLGPLSRSYSFSVVSTPPRLSIPRGGILNMHPPTIGELNPNDLFHNNPHMVTDLPISATFYVLVRPGREVQEPNPAGLSPEYGGP